MPRARRIWPLIGPLLLGLLTGCASRADTGDSTPQPMDPYEAGVPELQQALSAGRITSLQLVEAYLARIAAYDAAGPELNAVLRINPTAREEARRLDLERAQGGSRGPLHGIPILVKDNYDVAGMPTTGGSIALADHLPAADAFQVGMLRKAGVVILGKTNLHELAYGITTISSLGGQTRNPYAPDRNPGGSSGGTAAAVAASFAALGWGTDTCGSIRIPAAVNNLFGLRPTKGLSSIDGILPLSHTQDVGGPLARTMTDLAIGLDATIGSDPADPATAVLAGRSLPRFVEALDSSSLRGARIGILLDYFGSAPEEEETSRVVREALGRMRELGAEVVEVRIPGFEELLSATSTIDLEFKWDLYDYLGRTPSPPVRSLTEIVERELHHPAVAAVLRRSDRHERRPPEGYDAVLEKRARTRRAITDFLDEQELDALAYPSIRREAAPIGEPGLGNNCQLSATVGAPALTVPAGFTRAGVPVGLELLARPFDDARLVGFGYAFERGTHPRRPPASTPPLTTRP